MASHNEGLKFFPFYKNQPRPYFILCTLLFIGQLSFAFWFRPEGFLFHGRMLLFIVGLLLLIAQWDLTSLPITWPRFLSGFGLAALCTLLVFAGLGLCFLLGQVSFTYGNNGLSPDFRADVPQFLFFYLVTTIFGTEVIFRLLAFNSLSHSGQKAGLTNIIQATLYCFWLIPGLFSLFKYGEIQSILFFLVYSWLSALAAGYLLLISSNIIISGLFTTFSGFLSYYIVNDYDLGLNSAYYFVTSSSNYYWITLAFHLLLVGGLYFYAQKKTEII